jgi:RecJ-like exonuclease
MPKLVETICPRCDGNGYIKVKQKENMVEHDCPMCLEEFMHMGGITKWSGETLPEKGKDGS